MTEEAKMSGARRGFWRGFGAGVAATVVALVVTVLGLIVHARSRLEARMEEQRQEIRESRLYPVLSPPKLPELTEAERKSFGEVEGDWTVQSLDGRDVSLASLRGTVILLNFWATWCAPCVAELPTLEALRGQLGESPVRILLVSDEPIEVLRDFVRTHEVELPIHAVSGGVPSVLFPHGRPTTFVVDCTGQVVFRHSGAADWGRPEVAEYLRQLATGC